MNVQAQRSKHSHEQMVWYGETVGTRGNMDSDDRADPAGWVFA